MSDDSPTPAPKRRWFRFSLRTRSYSLRTLLVAVTLLLVVLGGIIQRGRVQRRVSAEVLRLGGQVTYECDGNQSSYSRLAQLIGRENASTLRWVMIPKVPDQSLKWLLSELKSLDTVTFLYVYGDQLDNGHIQQIAEIVSLESLSLAPAKELGRLDFRLLSALPKLDLLLLNSTTGITRKLMDMLSHLPALRTLDLSFSDLQDEAMADLTGFRELRDIDISFTRVTKDVFAALARAPKLDRVSCDMEVCDGAGGVEVIRQILPKVRVVEN